MVEHDVKNLGLAAEGRLKIEWAEQSMPVLRQVRERFAKEQPLKGLRSRRAAPRSRCARRTRSPRRTTRRRRS